MSGTEKQKIYYWDSCIYLAWLQEEISHGQIHLDAIKQVASENFAGKNIIITSAIVFIEVLAAKIGPEKEQQFRKSFRSQTQIAYDVDPAVAMKAREFRENCLNHPSGKKLSTPDAIHLATAAILKSDEFWTFDGGEKDKHLGLLLLTGDSRVDGLLIRKPVVQQTMLFS